METLRLSLALLLATAFSAFAAEPIKFPQFSGFRGTNNIIIRTNPVVGTVTVDGSRLQPASINLTNWSNLPTNVITSGGETNWVWDGSTLRPGSAGNVTTTNLQNWDKLIAKGSFITESRARTLSLGTNTLAVLTNAYLLLDSPTNDASQVVVQLGSAASSGAHLWVVNNQTNKGFTIYNGSTSGSGILRLEGNFQTSSNGWGIELMNQGNDWIEVRRFSPDATGFITIDGLWVREGIVLHPLNTNIAEIVWQIPGYSNYVTLSATYITNIFDTNGSSDASVFFGINGNGSTKYDSNRAMIGMSFEQNYVTSQNTRGSEFWLGFRRPDGYSSRPIGGFFGLDGPASDMMSLNLHQFEWNDTNGAPWMESQSDGKGGYIQLQQRSTLRFTGNTNYIPIGGRAFIQHDGLTMLGVHTNGATSFGSDIVGGYEQFNFAPSVDVATYGARHMFGQADDVGYQFNITNLWWEHKDFNGWLPYWQFRHTIETHTSGGVGNGASNVFNGESRVRNGDIVIEGNGAVVGGSGTGVADFSQYLQFNANQEDVLMGSWKKLLFRTGTSTARSSGTTRVEISDASTIVSNQFRMASLGGSGDFVAVDGSGNTFRTNAGGISLNPTPGYLPYNSNATSFGDSPWYRIRTNSLGFYSTNVFLSIYGDQSVFFGLNAGPSSPTGVDFSVAVGVGALQSILPSTGAGFNDGNTAVGNLALNSLIGSVSVGTDGSGNTAIGAEAMSDAITAGSSTALGVGAGGNWTNIIASTFLGYDAGLAAGAASISNVIAIGALAHVTNNNTVVIGNNGVNQYYFTGLNFSNRNSGKQITVTDTNGATSTKIYTQSGVIYSEASPPNQTVSVTEWGVTRGITVSGIDGTAIGNTPIWTNNTGRDFAVSRLIIQPTAVSGFAVAGVASLGKTGAGYIDIVPVSTLTGLSGTGLNTVLEPIAAASTIQNGDVLTLRMSTGYTASSITLRATVVGTLLP